MTLRDEMPATAAFIDALRAAFGRDAIDPSIRDGMRGRAGFWAEEGGRQVGTPMPGEYFPAFGPDRWERTPEGQAFLAAENARKRLKSGRGGDF